MSVTNITNSKSVLAKLLAQENLKIEHRNVPTAGFDPKNRVLILPIWKDMSTDLYDLLVGHEVGHAWDTPAQGWHDAIEEKGKGFKSFLNVVEDARIEKKIKNRYPGLRAPMYRGYLELFESNFFGVKDKDLSKLLLIDRLNLHFKIGHMLNIPFAPSENHFVTRMDNLNSWTDVYDLASELYQYHKENNETLTDFDDLEFGEEGWGEYDDSDNGFPDEGEGHDSRGGRNSNPYSITDVNFREKEKSLLSDKVKPYIYASLPVVNLNKCIIPYKKLYNILDFSRVDNYQDYIKTNFSDTYNVDIDIYNGNRLFNEYKEKNQKFIMYLVKEFELRRNAAQFARASVSKTGELDVVKVWAYKLKEDLFKRVTKIPNGKNHGMVMFIDWSGSMTNNISNTIEQTLALADFCRMVKIPFEVFAFTDSGHRFDKLMNTVPNYDNSREDIFALKDNDLYIHCPTFRLLNFLSSKMSKTEYRNAQIRLLQYAIAHDHSKDSNENYHKRRIAYSALPAELSLGGTPLDECILASIEIVDQFKTANKIDVMNTIFLTDGDGTETNCVAAIENGKLYARSIKGRVGNSGYNLIVTDKARNISVAAMPGEKTTSALLRMLKQRTDTNLVGYFITNRNVKHTTFNILSEYGKFIPEAHIAEYIKKNKFYDLSLIGYDSFFIILGKDLEIDDGVLKVDTNAKRDVMKAFIKNQKNKLINRVLLNKFIERIA